MTRDQHIFVAVKLAAEARSYLITAPEWSHQLCIGAAHHALAAQRCDCGNGWVLMRQDGAAVPCPQCNGSGWLEVAGAGAG